MRPKTSVLSGCKKGSGKQDVIKPCGHEATKVWLVQFTGRYDESDHVEYIFYSEKAARKWIDKHRDKLSKEFPCYVLTRFTEMEVLM